MKTVGKILASGLGVAALCASALPAAAISFTQPGATTGSPAGAVVPPGLYFANSANYGIGSGSPSQAVGIEVPAFIWNPGWNFLGAQYAAAVAFPLVESGTHNTNYLRGPFNPVVNPITLSWNLGNGIFVSFGEDIYIPISSDVVFASAPGVVSGASFEQRAAISYIANDWVASANGIVGLVTNDGAGAQGVNYVNVDLTLAHNFGKWQLGVIGYYAGDLNTTPINAALGRGEEFAAGGLVGYDFGPVNLQVKLTHEFITKGTTNYGVHDTRVWTSIVIPIWTPTPAAPRPLVAKY